MSKRWRAYLLDRLVGMLGLAAAFIGLLFLVALIVSIFKLGIVRLSWDFLTSFPSRFPEKAGIYPAIVGSLWIFVGTALFAIPLGVSAAIYLEEYAKKSWLANVLEINIANLAGVPSIIYGILGLEIFVRTLQMGQSLVAGSLTLALLVLPVVIVVAREALRAVPPSIREAAYALGATKWQTIWKQVLPAAFGNILTGIILALARAIGEAAPLIVVGALTYVPFIPRSPMDEFTVLPIQIFNWVSRPQHGFVINAAAAIIVLLVLVLGLNGIAIFLRYRSQRKVRW